VKRNFLFVKVVLPEKQVFFNQINGFAFIDKTILLKQLMWEKNTCDAHGLCFVSLHHRLLILFIEMFRWRLHLKRLISGFLFKACF